MAFAQAFWGPQVGSRLFHKEHLEPHVCGLACLPRRKEALNVPQTSPCKLCVPVRCAVGSAHHRGRGLLNVRGVCVPGNKVGEKTPSGLAPFF